MERLDTKVALPGIDVFCRRSGGEGLPPLVMLHGFMQDSSVWDGCAAGLEHRFSVIAPDLVGHGRTGRPSDEACYNISRIVCDLHRLATHLQIQPFNLVGYSLGGRVALMYALRYPDDLASLVLISSSFGPHDDDERERLRARDAQWISLLSQGMEGFVDYWERLPIFLTQTELPPSVRERTRRMRLSNDPEALARFLAGAGQGSMPDLRGSLATLKVPLLYVAGRRDRKYAGLAQAYSEAGAETVLLPCGHDVRLECEKTLIDTLDGFLMGDQVRSRR